MTITKITYKEAKKRLTSKVLERLRNIKDEDIDYSEIPELDARFWRKAKPLRGRPPKAICKDMVNLRLDHFAVTALRDSGRGWQTRVSNYISTGVRTGTLLSA
jgi:uncharacterized protein (DUF4415 family)